MPHPAMSREYEIRSDQTLTVIQQLLNRGITRIAAIIRHSARFYSPRARMEPFMNLTPEGIQHAEKMGQNLPPSPQPLLYSSHIGRCIETAYLIDKGFFCRHGLKIPHNQVNEVLAPFYLNDIEQIIRLLKERGPNNYLRDWFDHRIDESIMGNPVTATTTITRFMLNCIDGLADNEIALCVSHDWNIFLLKEFALGLSHEEAGDVGYLDGVVFYENNGQAFVTSYQTDPQPVETTINSLHESNKPK
jgi:broad specificity phosphatase PhoE